MRALFSAMVGLLVVACSDGPGYKSAATLAPTFTNLKSAVLVPKCLSCHSTTNAIAGVSVSTYEETMSSPGTVTPYQPSQSPLYTRCVNKLMPPPPAVLTDAELSLMYQWLVLGAPND